MKKIKFMIMTLAIAFSIGGAFATAPRQDCQGATQYKLSGGNYVLAGRYGIDYICVTPSSSVCTYYKVGSTYVPCMTGNYCTANCKTSNPTPKKAKN
jgi:hypothetical protein